MIIDNHFIRNGVLVPVFVVYWCRVQYRRRVEGSAEILQIPIQLDVSWLSVSVRLSRNRHVWSKVCCCEPTRSGLVWSVLVPESSLVHVTVLYSLVAK